MKAAADKKKKSFTTKDAVVMMLRCAQGYLSGEEISTRLRISRAAVHGAVTALREDGYVLDSVTNKGYRLLSSPDVLSAGEIAAYLADDPISSETLFPDRMARVKVLDTVDSTNRLLSQMALDGAPDGQIVIADCQTAGRGRLGRSFSSPGGMGIYFSCLIRPAAATGQISSFTALTCQTAVAVSRAIQSVCGVFPSIKWVNDLCFGTVDSPRKICGILTQMDLEPESAHVRHIVIGIGVNVRERRTDFPADIRNTAGSLFTETGQDIVRAHLAAEMIRQTDRLRSLTPQEEEAMLQHYRAHHLLTGKEIDVISGDNTRAGYVVCVENDYGLRVRFADGTEEVLHGGEVSVRTKHG